MIARGVFDFNKLRVIYQKLAIPWVKLRLDIKH